MSFAIDNEVKDRIRTAINIVDLLGSYMELRRQGRAFVAQCPFHDDRRPSLQINPDRQIWKCWVCDIGGDIFSFVMQKEGVGFSEAIRMLAERAGIEIEERKRPGNIASGDEKSTLLEAMRWAADQFHQCLVDSDEGAVARQYLTDRGISQSSIEKFRIGFAPESWSWLIDRAAKRSLSPEVLEAIGLLARNERGSRYDRFRGRAMFPINDPQGRPIAVGGRVLPGSTTESAKYINCNETRLYHKSHQLYGLDMARDTIVKTRQAVVMEGYTDVIMAVQHGITNAVACCGTALGESHIRLLKRYCDRVVLLLDGDEAGQRRTSEILELFVTAQMDLRILTLPDNLDPCDYLLKFGGEQLQPLIDDAVDALEHKLRLSCTGFDPLLDTHRANTALEEILLTMSRVSHDTLLSNFAVRLRQDQLIARLAKQFGIEQSEIRLRLDSIRKQTRDRERDRTRFQTQRTDSPTDPQSRFVKQLAAPKSSTGTFPSAPILYRYSDLSLTECELFEILAVHHELAPMAIERFQAESLNSETGRFLFRLYQELETEGYPLDFESFMSAVEDPQIKSVLVSIDDHASRKTPISLMTADERLHSLCTRLSGDQESAERKKQIQLLGRKNLDEQSEIDLLNQIVQRARMAHGINPTE